MRVLVPRFIETTVQRALDAIALVLHGNISFGDGVSPDNIKGQWVTFTSSGTPDAENTVAHTLGVVPVGFLIVRAPKSGYVYEGGTTWTTTNIYLKCTAATQTVTIFLLAA
jgi:hypothetical protein